MRLFNVLVLVLASHQQSVLRKTHQHTQAAVRAFASLLIDFSSSPLLFYAMQKEKKRKKKAKRPPATNWPAGRLIAPVLLFTSCRLRM